MKYENNCKNKNRIIPKVENSLKLLKKMSIESVKYFSFEIFPFGVAFSGFCSNLFIITRFNPMVF